MSPPITTPQLRRLQTLYSQLCAHTQQPGSRADRMAWASGLLGRSVASFSDLSMGDAGHLIEALRGQLGVKHPSQKKRSREAAGRHGKDGRRDGQAFRSVPQIVSVADLAVIQSYWERLGLTRERFDKWLRSPLSPLKKSDPVIRTKADANRVRWALKGRLQRAGLWEERKPE